MASIAAAIKSTGPKAGLSASSLSKAIKPSSNQENADQKKEEDSIEGSAKAEQKPEQATLSSTAIAEGTRLNSSLNQLPSWGQSFQMPMIPFLGFSPFISPFANLKPNQPKDSDTNSNNQNSSSDNQKRDSNSNSNNQKRDSDTNSRLDNANNQTVKNISTLEDWEDFGGKKSTPADDPYEKISNQNPEHKPNGTDDPIADYSKEITDPKDLSIYSRLDLLVKVYRNDSVGFGSNLLEASTKREADPYSRSQVLAMLVDSFKKDPNADKYLETMKEWGGLDVFLSEKLSFGINKSVGGYVSTSSGYKPYMALPYDLTDYTHNDIARHEAAHLKDSLADGKLDGLGIGDDPKMQEHLLSAFRNFISGSYDADKISKIDIDNFRYAAGYIRNLDNPSNEDLKNSEEVRRSFALTEARAVAEQEYANNPEAFRAIGGDFEKLADHFKEKVATYSESYVQKDGINDGSALK